MIADVASRVLALCDFFSSLENPTNTFVALCGCMYLLQFLVKFSRSSEKKSENISLKMTIDRVDDTPIVEHNTLTQKIKQKSKKIVMDAEKGKRESKRGS